MEIHIILIVNGYICGEIEELRWGPKTAANDM
jgi:hypothetical protein